MVKDSQNLSRVLLRVKLASPPSTGSLAAMLQLAGVCGPRSPRGIGNPALGTGMDGAKSGKSIAALAAGSRSQGRLKAGAGLLRGSYDSTQGAADGIEQEGLGGQQHGWQNAGKAGRSTLQGRAQDSDTGAERSEDGGDGGTGHEQRGRQRSTAEQEWPRLRDGGQSYRAAAAAAAAQGVQRRGNVEFDEESAEEEQQRREGRAAGQQGSKWKLQVDPSGVSGYAGTAAADDGGRSPRTSAEGYAGGDAESTAAEVLGAARDAEPLQGGAAEGSEVDSEEQKGLEAGSVSEAGDDDNADLTCDWRWVRQGCCTGAKDHPSP